MANGENIVILSVGWDYYMIKLSGCGDSITSMELPDTIADWAYDIYPTPDTGFCLFCDCETLGTYHPRIVKYSSDFEFEWLASPIGLPIGSSSGATKDGFIAPNGDIVAGVYKYGTPAWVGIWCLDTLGNQKWLKGIYIDTFHEYADFSVTPDGNYGLLYTAFYGPYDFFSGFLYVVDADSHDVFSERISVPYSAENMVQRLAGMPDNHWWVMGTAHDGTNMVRFFQLLNESGTALTMDTLIHHGDTVTYYEIAYHPEMGFVKGGKYDNNIYLEWQKTLELGLFSPHGGELWFAGDTQNILWSSRNIDSVSIQYSTDGGASWNIETGSTPSTGSYLWLLPDIYSTQCLVRLTCLSDSTCQALTESLFTIDTASVEGKSIDLIAPSGDTVMIGVNTRIIWNSVRIDSVIIDYSRDNGITWESIEERYPADSCGYNWTVPPRHTNYGLLKVADLADSSIFDISDEYFYVGYNWPWVDVLTPKGGDSLVVGDTIEILWTFGNFGEFIAEDFFVFLSTDDGDEWENIHNTLDTTYLWVVPDLISDSCIIGVATSDSFAGDTVSRMRPLTEENISYGFSGVFSIVDSILGISELKPERLSVGIEPNPFNSACRISVPKNAIIKIFDINGRIVYETHVGAYRNTPVIWRPDKSLGSGVYLVRAKIGDKSITKRMVLVK
ncbi:hypothetical protein DRQ36_08670 [bacterium]|nr:MAG: hypothetical protein DRQ36_08670 [bacterium]